MTARPCARRCAERLRAAVRVGRSQDDRDVVLAAVRQNGNALRHAPDALRRLEIVLAAVRHEATLRYASAALRKTVAKLPRAARRQAGAERGAASGGVGTRGPRSRASSRKPSATRTAGRRRRRRPAPRPRPRPPRAARGRRKGGGEGSRSRLRAPLADDGVRRRRKAPAPGPRGLAGDVRGGEKARAPAAPAGDVREEEKAAACAEASSRVPPPPAPTEGQVAVSRERRAALPRL